MFTLKEESRLSTCLEAKRRFELFRFSGRCSLARDFAMPDTLKVLRIFTSQEACLTSNLWRTTLRKRVIIVPICSHTFFFNSDGKVSAVATIGNDPIASMFAALVKAGKQISKAEIL